MANPETTLVGRIRRAILAEYPRAFVVKLAGGMFQTIGLPDLLAIVDGRAYGLEVKCQRSGESAQHARDRATPLQLAVLEKMRRAGAGVGVVLSPEEALEVIRSS